MKSVLGSVLAILGFSSGGYIYANRIEPSMLEIKKQQMMHPFIPKSFNGMKIVQFSDTHLGFQYDINQFQGLIKKINELKPDIVLFTGDLMDKPDQYREIHKITPILKQVNAPLGQFCIYGNHDHGGYGTEIYRNVMQESNFTILLNESVPIQLKDGSCIYLMGVDDAMLGKPDFAKARKHVPGDKFKLLLSHAPDLADTASLYDIQWQVSGHSHGGQVKVPFLGPLIIPPFARKYPEGLYSIGDYPMSLYVNRGIGTTRLPFRFMAKPELTIFTLKSGQV